MKIPRFKKAMNEKQQLHNIRRAKLAQTRLSKELLPPNPSRTDWLKFQKASAILNKRFFQSYYNPEDKK